MEKIFSAIVVVFLFPVFLFAQTSQKSLSPGEFRNFLQKEYYFLANPGATEVLSNFASLDSEDGEITFAGTIFLDRAGSNSKTENWILSFNAKGSGNEDAFPIYSGNKFTSNVGLGVQLKIPFFGKKSFLEYSNDEKTAIDLKEQQLKTELESAKIKILNRSDSLALVKSVYTSQNNIIDAEKKIDNATKAIDKIAVQLNLLDTSTNTGQAKADSLKKESKKLENEIIKLEVGIKEDSLKVEESKYKLNNLPNTDDLFWIYEQQNISERRKVRESLPILGHRVGWISFNYELENTVFKHFIPSNSFESQINKQAYLAHTFSIQYSRSVLYVDSFSYYFSGGVSFSLDDNYSSLSTMKTVERTNYGPNPDDRYSVKETSVLTGDYKTGLHTYKAFGDLYTFLFKDNRAAIHTRLEAQKKKTLKDQLNLGVGFLFNFTDKEDKKSRINAELYFELDDVTNANESDEKAFQRGTFGLRFSVPFLTKPKT